jgi:hypothetical protein
MDPPPKIRPVPKPTAKKSVAKTSETGPSSTKSSEIHARPKRAHVEKSNAQMLSNHAGIRTLFKQQGSKYDVNRVSRNAILVVKALHGEEKHSPKDLLKIISVATQITKRRQCKTADENDVKLAISTFLFFKE